MKLGNLQVNAGILHEARHVNMWGQKYSYISCTTVIEIFDKSVRYLNQSLLKILTGLKAKRKKHHSSVEDYAIYASTVFHPENNDAPVRDML